MSDQPQPRTYPWAGPLLSLVLLLLFLAIAASLPYHQLRGGYSDAGAWIHTHILPARNVSVITGLDLLFLKEPGAIRVIDEDSWDEGTRLLEERPAEVLRISYRPQRFRTGLWAITHEVNHHALRLDFGGNFNELDRQQARREFLKRAPAYFDWVPDSTFSRLGRGEIIDSAEIRPEGFVINAVSVALLVLLVVSLRWVRQVPGWIRVWHTRRRVAAKRCPKCGYSIAGLSGGICPECGRIFA